jgi:glutamyl-Q tRNA(Asp) synthetase
METAKPYRGRFAPSPTGPLHMGSLLAAMGSWLMARQAGGHWIIRIEDIDPPREIKGAASGQIELLKRFGMESDEPVLWQSTRDGRYLEVLQKLMASGDAFECFCSRKDMLEYQGIHRSCINKHAEKNPAIRLRIPDIVIEFEDLIQGRFSQAVGRETGDMVIRRADGFWAYQLAVVIDDADQGITHIVRGMDLLESTPRQIYLQRLLEFATPEYAHLPLVVDSSGHKLSKSLAAFPLDPNNPIAAMRIVWKLLGQEMANWPDGDVPERLLLQAITRFDATKIPRGSQMPTA